MKSGNIEHSTSNIEHRTGNGRPAIRCSTFSPRRAARSRISGYALMTVLVIGAVSALILASSVTWTINNARMNERNNALTITLAAAEAATENVAAHMLADMQIGGETLVANNLPTYRVLTPQGDPYWSQFEFSDGLGNKDRTGVEVLAVRVFTNLPSSGGPLYGWSTTCRLISNARMLAGRHTTSTNAALLEMQVASIPLFQFAIFANGPVTLTNFAPQTINARVHVNGNLRVSGREKITFTGPVTATGSLQMQHSDATFLGDSNPRTNVASLSLSASNIQALVSQQGYFTNAGMTVIVGNSNITVTLRKGSSTRILPPDIPFVSATNVFWNDRESNWVRVAELDLGQLRDWWGARPYLEASNLLLVADTRAATGVTNHAVRLVNAARLPSFAGSPSGSPGFTIVTTNALYLKGNYNTTSTVPAALISDSLTVLSSAWQDSDSTRQLDERRARDTIIVSSIVTGRMSDAPPANATAYLPRLLEDWHDDDLLFTNSIVSFCKSTEASRGIASHAFKLPQPPHKLQFSFEPSVTNASKLPPGTPMIRTVIRSRWANPPPDVTAF